MFFVQEAFACESYKVLFFIQQIPTQMTLQLVLPNQFSGPRVVEDPHGFESNSLT